MWLIAGLGNPGPEYEGTRHNLGFMALDALSRRWKIPVLETGGRIALGRGRRRGGNIVLAKPLTFMNRSGEVLGPLALREGIGESDLLVLVDDLDLPLGTLRFRPGGGTAGHRGMESLVQCLGHDRFRRIRLGIGRPASETMDESQYVLSPFAEDELATVQKVIEAASVLTESVVFGGRNAPVTLKVPEGKEGL
ncbi:MAG: aminoacyl-tRNA hydrolase [bacterium]|nr:MAG: aminoacyl-tRNA hydrolase [bacterium]